MKKLINAPDAVVADALRGVQAAHGDRVRVTFDPYWSSAPTRRCRARWA